MKTTLIKEQGSNSVNDTLTQKELIKRIAQLEQEKVECKLAAKETLLKYETKYQTMLESVDAHITLVDRNLRIVWANGKAKEIFGRNIIGKSCCEALYGKKKFCCNESSCITRHAFRNGNIVKRNSLRTIALDGTERHFEGIARAVSWDNNDRPSLVVKIYKDITDRRLAENELRESLKMLRKNLAGTIQAIFRTVETKDAYTAGQQRRTTDIARANSI